MSIGSSFLFLFFLRWLEHVRTVITDNTSDNMQISWSAFHANEVKSPEHSTLDISSLLPLFQEESKSPAMIRHSMNVVRDAINFLNPGQSPVLACDQPLYALAKEIQWTWPETHGENQYVVMLGGLHIELTALKALGKWLDDSGWSSALVQAGIATTGTADSFHKASHITRTRHAHQVRLMTKILQLLSAPERTIHF